MYNSVWYNLLLMTVPQWPYIILDVGHNSHNEHDGVSNHQHHDCLLNPLFRHRSKKTSKLCITGLCKGNPPVTNEFPTQRASNVENISVGWHHHRIYRTQCSWCVGSSYSNFHCSRHCAADNWAPSIYYSWDNLVTAHKPNIFIWYAR